MICLCEHTVGRHEPSLGWECRDCPCDAFVDERRVVTADPVVEHRRYLAMGGPMHARILEDLHDGADIPVHEGRGDDDWPRTGFYRLHGQQWLWHPTWHEGQ